MDIRQIRGWMYNRTIPSQREHTSAFLNGLNEFIALACQKSADLTSGEIRCPCTRCRNLKYLDPIEVEVHLCRWGFISDYWYWTCHGESDPTLCTTFNTCPSTSGTAQEGHRFENMVYDAFDPQFRMHPNQQIEQSPNKDAQEFYDLLHAAQKPLWPGCTNHTELSTAVRLLTIKSDGNISQRSFNEYMALMKETHPEGNVIPEDYYRAKKIVSKLGLTAKKVDCCDKGCMLFYTDEDMKLKHCKFCGGPRYHRKKVGRDNYKEVLVKRMHYLPLILRLKRLYASMSSAPHMRWHYENKRQPGVMCHPSNGKAWKYFDGKHLDFAKEPRNVRLGLFSDGFMPFGNGAKPYSCWPVIVTPYNIPPELCMTTPYMFLTLIIPGPDNPKEKIDVYLQPLIDELKLLWNEGVVTYDISKKQNFIMKAALMWTVNDFPAYVMDIKGKTKDNVKARRDLKEYCRRRELELVENLGGKPLKPKAKFVLSKEQNMAVCKWVSELKMPDGYASNLSRCVTMKDGKFLGMKSHDCHIFMERLLPIAFSALPLQVWRPLAELSKFFKDLCSSTLQLNDLRRMRENIIITTCKLERIFPPGFFNSMEHLHIHLPYEVIAGGPIQYRWMYPFER
ncbi:uncharacterized protein LOC130737272 [Lotus japonicus]|uniref:uncharacterized protein LOC130737272 n=1 Tax=Lotus japonicus TaxID=34305 RepID=UPI002589C256|nr:uncharacterized protein LOC130737272 [Lotus japonicus]